MGEACSQWGSKFGDDDAERGRVKHSRNRASNSSVRPRFDADDCTSNNGEASSSMAAAAKMHRVEASNEEGRNKNVARSRAVLLCCAVLLSRLPTRPISQSNGSVLSHQALALPLPLSSIPTIHTPQQHNTDTIKPSPCPQTPAVPLPTWSEQRHFVDQSTAPPSLPPDHSSNFIESAFGQLLPAGRSPLPLSRYTYLLSCTVKKAPPDTTTTPMAHVSSNAMAFASPTPSLAIPKLRNAGDVSGTANYEKAASALLTPPTSISPELAAHSAQDSNMSPPPINIQHEIDSQIQQGGMPLSKGALSDLDGSVTITPSMLARDHLPGIMLGNGPRPIRYVMGELTQTVPGFSRIPPAKARRIVVAALESRNGGGPDGNVEFCKTGWGRWDAHVKGSSRDSGIGSFNDGHLSPPRSEQGSYAMSHGDSAINMPTPHAGGKYRDQHSRGSWTNSSIREEDEFDLDMDMGPIEEAAEKMSLDGISDTSDSEMDDETDDDDWAAVGVEALRKASLSSSSALQQPKYRALSVPYTGRLASGNWNRRPSTNGRRPHSTSVPVISNFGQRMQMQTPEERAAVEALMSMGSM